MSMVSSFCSWSETDINIHDLQSCLCFNNTMTLVESSYFYLLSIYSNFTHTSVFIFVCFFLSSIVPCQAHFPTPHCKCQNLTISFLVCPSRSENSLKRTTSPLLQFLYHLCPYQNTSIGELIGNP